MREALHERGVSAAQRAPSGPSPRIRGSGLPVARASLLWIGLKIYDWMAGSLGLGPFALGRAAERGRAHADHPCAKACAGESFTPTASSTTARLAITLARTFADLGGTALNYVQGHGFHTGAAAGSPSLARRTRRPARNCASRPAPSSTRPGVYVDRGQAARRSASAPPL